MCGGNKCDCREKSRIREKKTVFIQDVPIKKVMALNSVTFSHKKQ